MFQPRPARPTRGKKLARHESFRFARTHYQSTQPDNTATSCLSPPLHRFNSRGKGLLNHHPGGGTDEVVSAMLPSRRLLQQNTGNPGRIPGIPAADPPAGVSSDVVVILAALLCALICVVGLAAVARCARSRRNSTTGDNASYPSESPAHAAAGSGGGTHGGSTASVTTTTTTTSTASSKGLKKKALKALPKLAYADAVAAAAAARGALPAAGDDDDDDEEGRKKKAEEILSECAICLSEFGEREEVRVMPQCGHGFHVACVDAWLRSNSSCPSCRRPIVLHDPTPPPKRCRKCEDIILDAVVAASASSSSSSAVVSSHRGHHGGHGGGGFLP
ncbi:hypothetical protein BRADI_3g32215v3 [Brachypodium distachyon]|uniref:RING-type domain-containing protein n=2 Tax=Brachypodium distachyon TaxID=15368 RepID=A0A2K2D0I2_BRADI|nr:hypothetical protein BRADI_3g32215v3 [Brachypodium distachyon]